MRYPPAETAEKHQRILEEAARAYRENGFAGASVADIMKATGLTHGPFYNHFSSKEALIAETLRHISQKTLDETDSFEHSSEGKSAFVRSYLSGKHRDEPGNGCMMAALGGEVGRSSAFKPAFTSHVRATIDRMAANFPWSSKSKARGDAIRALTSMVGAIVLARAIDDAALSDEILKEAADGLVCE